MFDRNRLNIPRSGSCNASSSASVTSSYDNNRTKKSAEDESRRDHEELEEEEHAKLGNEATNLNLVLSSNSPVIMDESSGSSSSSRRRSNPLLPTPSLLLGPPPTLLVQHPPYHDYANITLKEMKLQHSQRESNSSSSSSSSSKKIKKPPPSHDASPSLQEKFESSSPLNRTKIFPVSVHELLTFVDHHPEPYYFESIQQSICPGDIIRWEPHGRSFMIYNRTLLAQCLLPMFFPYQNEYAS
jgi:hypothetical protein